MNIKSYRKKTAGQIKTSAMGNSKLAVFRDESAPYSRRLEALRKSGMLDGAGDLAVAEKLALDREAPEELRAAALALLDPVHSKSGMRTLIKVLENRKDSPGARLAALNAMKMAGFMSSGFEGSKPEFIAALRAASDAEDPKLRRRALGMLAREKHAPTQKRLIEGLRDAAKAAVPPEKALQFLGYFGKLEIADLLLEIVRNPPSSEARLQALRLLAADPKSKPLFTKLLIDKRENLEARLIAISALHALEPGFLLKKAAALVADKDEDDAVQEACLTAASTFDETGVAVEEFRKAAHRLQASGKTPSVRRSAKSYLAKTPG